MPASYEQLELHALHSEEEGTISPGESIRVGQGKTTRWPKCYQVFSWWNKTRYTLALCLLATLCLFADQNIMAPNLTQIATEFGISPEDRDARLGGDVSVAFFIVGAPFGIVAGWYTDRLPRNRMYGAVVIVGSLGMFFSSLVVNHLQLLCARALTGVAIGGAAPILFSLLSDLFPVEQRNGVVAMVGFAMGVGQLIGQALSAAMVQVLPASSSPLVIPSSLCLALKSQAQLSIVCPSPTH